MLRRASILGILTLLVASCGKTQVANESWYVFREIELLAPKSASLGEQDGVLPGPGGLGGVPTGERPSVDVGVDGPHGFHLTIFREPGPRTLEGEKSSMASNKYGTNPVGKVTANGWELTYDAEVYGTPTGRSRLFYAAVAGKHFTCIFAEPNCKDVAAAEAVCRSMRAKTTTR